MQEEAERRSADAKAMRAKGMSQRAIGEATGVSQTQVVADLRDAGEQGCSPGTPPVIQGRDGKLYPSPEAQEERVEKAKELSDQGLTQREIAEELGVNQSLVNPALRRIPVPPRGEGRPVPLAPRRKGPDP